MNNTQLVTTDKDVDTHGQTTYVALTNNVQEHKHWATRQMDTGFRTIRDTKHTLVVRDIYGTQITLLQE